VVGFEDQLSPALLLGCQLRLFGLQFEWVQVGCLVAPVLLATCHRNDCHGAAYEVLFQSLVLIKEDRFYFEFFELFMPAVID